MVGPAAHHVGGPGTNQITGKDINNYSRFLQVKKLSQDRYNLFLETFRFNISNNTKQDSCFSNCS